MNGKRTTSGATGTRSTAAPATITVHVPLTFTVRGGRKTIIGEVTKQSHLSPRTRFDDSTTKAFARAYRWKQRLEDGTYATVGELAKAEHITKSYVTRILRLNLLAPDIVEAALDARTTVTAYSVSEKMPMAWHHQRIILLGGHSA
jgi:hypothetical protein